ncbi:glycoside hydrolase family 114 protein, partial [Lentithecium fluviatile CBS 122367]
GTVWDIVLEGGNTTLQQKIDAPGTVIDVDLEDNYKNGELTNIKQLAAKKKVICYFSAGSRESWRLDDKKFNASDYGREMPEWKGEFWVDVKSANVRRIMKERIEMAAKAGCHAVDPDNVDGYVSNLHQDGYKYDKSVYAEYVKYLAGVAEANNLAIGLKNSMAIIPDVIKVIHFAVNEQCHENEECKDYRPATTAGLAVFNIEY